MVCLQSICNTLWKRALADAYSYSTWYVVVTSHLRNFDKIVSNFRAINKAWYLTRGIFYCYPLALSLSDMTGCPGITFRAGPRCFIIVMVNLTITDHSRWWFDKLLCLYIRLRLILLSSLLIYRNKVWYGNVSCIIGSCVRGNCRSSLAKNQWCGGRGWFSCL